MASRQTDSCATTGYEAELWAMAQARQSTIGQTVDRAMAAIEHDNLALKYVLP